MAVIKYSVVIVILVSLYIDNSFGQLKNHLQPSKKDCPESKGYAWISCLLFSVRCDNKNCQRYKNTSLIDKIICREHRTPCGTCIPKYYLNDIEIDCDAPQGAEEDCPPHKKLVDCKLDPCFNTICPVKEFSNAMCRSKRCGGCFTEYYINSTWQSCPVSISEIQPDAMVVQPMAHRQASPQVVEFGGRSAVHAPPMAGQPARQERNSVCPNGKRVFECPASVCENERCVAHPRAKCRIDNCGGCRPQWTISGIYIVENCSSTACPSNTLEMVCNDDPCKYSTCLKYRNQNAVCRPSRCGGCKAEWLVNGEVVDCDIKTGIDRPCPDGSTPNATCPIGTCSFTICPLNSKVRCTVNYCGCYPEFRDMNGNEAECDYYLWNPRRKPKKKQVPPLPSIGGRSSSGDTPTRRTDLLDIPLDMGGPVPVAPVIPSGGGGPSPVDEAVLRESAQRGLQAALGNPFELETSGNPLHPPKTPGMGRLGETTNNKVPPSEPKQTGTQMSTDVLRKSAEQGLQDVLGIPLHQANQIDNSNLGQTGRNEFGNVDQISVEFPPASSFDSIHDPFLSDIPPPPSVPIVDSFGDPSPDILSQNPVVPKPRPDVKGRKRFGGGSSSVDVNPAVADNTPAISGKSRFGESPQDTGIPLAVGSFGRGRFGRQDVSNSNPPPVDTGAAARHRNRFGNRNVENSAVTSNIESPTQILDNPPFVDAFGDFSRRVDKPDPSVVRTAISGRSSKKQPPSQSVQDMAPIAKKLSKKLPAKVIEDKRRPSPKNRNPLKRRGDMRPDKKPLPDVPMMQDIPLDKNDPSMVDMAMSGQPADPGSNIPAQNEAMSNVVILFNDNLGSQNLPASMLNWLMSGLLSDMTGVPVQSMDKQP